MNTPACSLLGCHVGCTAIFFLSFSFFFFFFWFNACSLFLSRAGIDDDADDDKIDGDDDGDDGDGEWLNEVARTADQ
jgi:uncharacterized membrane protein